MTLREDYALARSIMGRTVRATSHNAQRHYTFIVYGTEIEPAEPYHNGHRDRLLIKVWWKNTHGRWNQADVWIGYYTYEVMDA